MFSLPRGVYFLWALVSFHFFENMISFCLQVKEEDDAIFDRKLQMHLKQKRYQKRCKQVFIFVSSSGLVFLCISVYLRYFVLLLYIFIQIFVFQTFEGWFFVV